MSKENNCCDSCFEIIAKQNSDAARLWLDICEIEITSKKVFGIEGSDFEELTFLEKKGFIITTDSPIAIFIKVLGKKQDDSGVYFCGGHCECES